MNRPSRMAHLWMATAATLLLATAATAVPYHVDVAGTATGAGGVTVIVEDFTGAMATMFPVNFSVPSGSTADNSALLMAQACDNQLPDQFTVTLGVRCVTIDGPISNVTANDTVPGQTFTASIGACGGGGGHVTRAPALGFGTIVALGAGLLALGVRRSRRRIA